MTTHRKKIGQLCSVITKGTTPTTLGSAYRESGIPFLRAQNLEDKELSLTQDFLFIDQKTDELLQRSKILPGDVLLAIAGTIGRTATVPLDAMPMNCNQAVAILRPSSDVDSKYLQLCLKSKETQRQIHGAKVSATISNLSLSCIKEIEIPLPPLPEQKRIAAILDKADAIRRRREKAIELTDSYLRSVFLEMFGDPTNLPQVAVGDIADVKGGKRLPKGAEYEESPTAHPYIRVVDFKNKSVDTSDLRFISEDIHKKISRYTISSNDVYISIAGTIGVVGTVPPELSGANLTENAAKLVIKNNAITPAYLCWALSSPIGQAQIRAKTMATSQPKLALFRIEEILIPLPPLEHQQHFIRVAQQAESLLKRMSDGLTLTLGLSKSLTASLLDRSGHKSKEESLPVELEAAHAI